MKPALTRERFERALDRAAALFEVPRREVAGACRVKRVVRARQAVFAACYRAFDTSSTEIGWYANRDHTTVLWGIERADERWSADEDYADRVREIMRYAVYGTVGWRRAA